MRHYGMGVKLDGGGFGVREISPELRRFIQSTINSVEQLEVLLFLMSNAEQGWTAQEVSDRTRLAVESVAAKMEELHRAELLATEPGEGLRYRYAPTSNAIADEVARSLNDAYKERKDTIIQLIFSRPLKNVRIFADAFRIKKEED
jgi:hypothetical protein